MSDDLALVPKPSLIFLVWDSLKRAILQLSWVDALRWRLSQRKIRSLHRQLVTRRGFLSGSAALLLAPYIPAFAPRSDQEIREQIVAEYLKTSRGRARLAQSMIMPLRRRLDYTAFSRKILMVDQLPAGATPVYYREPSRSDEEV